MMKAGDVGGSRVLTICWATCSVSSADDVDQQDVLGLGVHARDLYLCSWGTSSWGKPRGEAGRGQSTGVGWHSAGEISAPVGAS